MSCMVLRSAEPARRVGWSSRALKTTGWVLSPVACVVGTRPGDYGAERVASWRWGLGSGAAYSYRVQGRGPGTHPPRPLCGVRWVLTEAADIEDSYACLKNFWANVGFGRIWTEFVCRTRRGDVLETLPVMSTCLTQIARRVGHDERWSLPVCLKPLDACRGCTSGSLLR